MIMTPLIKYYKKEKKVEGRGLGKTGEWEIEGKTQGNTGNLSELGEVWGLVCKFETQPMYK